MADRPRTARTRWAVALARLGLPQLEIARRIGTSQTRVSLLCAGLPPKREELEAVEREFQIAPSWVGEAPIGAAAPARSAALARPSAPALALPAAPSAPIEASSETIRQEAARRLSEVRQIWDSVMLAPDATPAEKMLVSQQCSKVLTALGKLSGETAEISTSKILRSPAWQKIKQAWVRALEPWPDALRAASEAIAELEQL